MPIGKIEYNDIYINKKEEEFAEEVENKFKQIDVRWMRDDQEIYEAWQIVLDDCINKITNAKAMRVNNKEIQGDKVIETQNLYMDEALESLRESKKHFQERRNKVVEEHNRLGLGCRITTTTENKQLIAGIANIIEKAEEDALKTIRLKCNPMQETKNAVLESSIKTDENGNYIIDNWEIVRQKPMYEMSNDGTLTFTNRCNSLLPKYAFQGLFKKDEIYEIDYAGCKKTSIIERIKRLTWETKLLLTKDPSWNFLLMNSKWEIRENETIIYEWVTLKRDSLKTYEARQEIEQQKKGLWRITADIDSMRDPEFDPQLKDLLKDIPNGLKSKLHNLSVPEYRKFLVATENRLADLLKDARSQGYELAVPECITKLRTSNGCMELHLINEQDEMTKKIWFNDEILWEKLYNLIGGSEWDYKEYLTKRVQAKRWTFEVFEKSNLIDLKAEQWEKCLTSQEIMWIKGGIAKLTQLIDNFRNSEGDSYDDDDFRLVKMKHLLRDAKYSLWNTNLISKDKFIKNIINPFWKEWKEFKNIPETITKMSGNKWTTTRNPDYDKQYNNLQSIFFWEFGEQDKAIRGLWTFHRVLDKTETSFVGDSIAQKLKTKDKDLNKCLDEIDNILSLDPENDLDDKGELKDKTKQAIIDELYTAAGTNNLMDKLIEKCFIPQERASDPEVQKKVNDLAESLKKQQTFIDSLNENTIIKQEEQELLQLQAKENKTYEERTRLQTLQYLKEHPDEAREIHEKSLTMMKTWIKYLWIDEILRNSLMPIFVDKGWGAEWANANIYEDIIGFWAFDLSDENAQLMGEILKEIAITVAIGVATGWVWAFALWTILRWWALLARGAKWINLANKIVKIIKVSKTAWKELNTIQKAGKLLYTSSALLLEWTAFNAASNIVHAVTNGTSLDNLDLNPISKENIKTAAFLWCMSLWNQIGGKLITKIGQKTKLNIDRGKGLQEAANKNPAVRWALLWSEIWTMLASEQVINLTFWYDVVDPETWEVHTERSLQAPTQADLIQMIGMVLAFKMVKPQLWAKYEQKLSEWTLEICRSTVSGEFLFRTPEKWLIPFNLNTENQYFNWKYHKFEVTEQQALWNSQMMDSLVKDINANNQAEKLQTLRQEISTQYQQATWKELTLTDEQLLSIIDAHEQDWILGELTLWQLHRKVQILDKVIQDKDVRRFLLEAGFCGKFSTPLVWKYPSLRPNISLEQTHNRYKEQGAKETGKKATIRDFQGITPEKKPDIPLKNWDIIKFWYWYGVFLSDKIVPIDFETMFVLMGNQFPDPWLRRRGNRNWICKNMWIGILRTNETCYLYHPSLKQLIDLGKIGDIKANPQWLHLFTESQNIDFKIDANTLVRTIKDKNGNEHTIDCSKEYPLEKPNSKNNNKEYSEHIRQEEQHSEQLSPKETVEVPNEPPLLPKIPEQKLDALKSQEGNFSWWWEYQKATLDLFWENRVPNFCWEITPWRQYYEIQDLQNWFLKISPWGGNINATVDVIIENWTIIAYYNYDTQKYISKTKWEISEREFIILKEEAKQKKLQKWEELKKQKIREEQEAIENNKIPFVDANKIRMFWHQSEWFDYPHRPDGNPMPWYGPRSLIENQLNVKGKPISINHQNWYTFLSATVFAKSRSEASWIQFSSYIPDEICLRFYEEYQENLEGTLQNKGNKKIDPVEAANLMNTLIAERTVSSLSFKKHFEEILNPSESPQIAIDIPECWRKK